MVRLSMAFRVKQLSIPQWENLRTDTSTISNSKFILKTLMSSCSVSSLPHVSNFLNYTVMTEIFFHSLNINIYELLAVLLPTDYKSYVLVCKIKLLEATISSTVSGRNVSTCHSPISSCDMTYFPILV